MGRVAISVDDLDDVTGSDASAFEGLQGEEAMADDDPRTSRGWAPSDELCGGVHWLSPGLAWRNNLHAVPVAVDLKGPTTGE